MANVSKQHRDELLEKISKIREFITNSKADKNTRNLLQYLNEIAKDIKGKKYGLVFEEHREAIDEKLDTHIPVLVEEEKLAIDNGGEQNFLIEGDNLAALKLLEKTHKGKIDVIYIDPPYNTGKNEKQDFHYDDKFVDINDTFRHSKWISFMEKRLRVGKELLKRSGLVFISIDDNEQADLKMLCDEVFGIENHIATLPTIMNLKGNQDEYAFAGTHEYTLVYSKCALEPKFNLFPINDEEIEEWQEDEIGFFKRGANLKATGVNGPREKRPNLFFPIYVQKNGNFSVTEKLPNSIKVLPITKGEEMSWRWEKARFIKYHNDVIINIDGDEVAIYKKQRPELGDLPSKKPKTIFYKPTYSSGNGTAQIKAIFGNKVFNNPKPLDLINDFLYIGGKKNAIVLDFFAGSGTTGHSVMTLNAEDGGHRKFILCTNNENNICRNVTYQRLKTVITGKRKDNTKYSDGLSGSLKYFRIDYVPINDKLYYEYADELLLHIRELVELENGINFSNNGEIAIVLTDAEMEEFVEDYKKKKSIGVKKIYRGHNVLLSNAQTAFLKKHNIKINVIPDYYYQELAK